MLGPQTASQSGGSFPHERAWTPGLGNCSDGVQSRQIGSEAHVRRQQNVQRGRQLLQALPKELRQVVKTCSQLYQLKAQIASDRATANECATTLDVRHAAREYFQRQLMEMEQLAEHMTSLQPQPLQQGVCCNHRVGCLTHISAQEEPLRLGQQFSGLCPCQKKMLSAHLEKDLLESARWLVDAIQSYNFKIQGLQWTILWMNLCPFPIG
ncbi:hypothetical protein WJX84_004829 [Apatococcus fuscideae]|uniref:Uncharacterized protein n=1 Tax=Apatococcus fuscideae TaxID=2026836 RepID=A0AAW1SYJ5_9CHLO